VKAGALDLLAERLPMIAINVRQEVTDAVKKIIDWVRIFIESRNDDPVSQSAFRALRSIASSLQPGEESTVNDVVPSILSVIRQQTAGTPIALASLVPLPSVFFPFTHAKV
jgi:U3 small nucleolar RNA-associated protein 10